MLKRGFQLSDNNVRLALLICIVALIADISLRLTPQLGDERESILASNAVIFSRSRPSPEWREWYTEIQRLRESEARRKAQSEMEANAQAEASKPIAKEEKDDQRGDLDRLKIGRLEYRLFAVFRRAIQGENEERFAVLDGKKEALQIKSGDVIGSYEVSEVMDFSVTFNSTTDDRVVTLWLFGKGP